MLKARASQSHVLRSWRSHYWGLAWLPLDFKLFSLCASGLGQAAWELENYGVWLFCLSMLWDFGPAAYPLGAWVTPSGCSG